MKKLILAFLLAAAPVLGMAAGGNVQLDDANIDLTDKESLQRGAKLFMNYCLSCHSAKYQRYNRMARDLDMTEDEVKQNLMFTTDKIGDTMNIAMDPEDAAAWFGAAPPDLSVITRARGVDWVYTYLRGFEPDESRPFGVNNKVFPDVGMPHVLWKLQKDQAVEKFDSDMRDLTAFMAYVGEPIAVERKRIGTYVLIFIAIFFVLSYLLKKEYWKDVPKH
ncbi:cytochrome c1 [Solemya velesiana gill symbiont]|uniref:Cytochrome c1 n=1 Tax=Solemya velesiana gill symbiont TaxID=1918948 RepID=A0A1T2KX56_9GAMM|nr:cytochrome c1 [Solemya velesiana gill symbiont]OOZ37425.1 cytochrome c1 [Solemya velesiana gill symbiont]